MSLKGWAELVHEQRIRDLESMSPERRRAKVLEWVREDGLDEQRAKEAWPDYLASPEEQLEIAKKVGERDAANKAAADAREALHRFEYEVVNMTVDSDASSVINRYAKKGWRLHTYSQSALDGGGFKAGFMKAFGGPGIAFVNVLTLVFERDRKGS